MKQTILLVTVLAGKGPKWQLDKSSGLYRGTEADRDGRKAGTKGLVSHPMEEIFHNTITQ